MSATTRIRSIFNCDLERAFKTPMLCDVKKVHTGYGLLPAVTHCTDDTSWGKIGGSRRVFMKKNVFFHGGEAALDTVLERIENKHWKIEITDIKNPSFGISRFVGEWDVDVTSDGKVQVTYTYTLHPSHVLYQPFIWLFTKTGWRIYMAHVIANVKQLAYSKAPYVHA